MRLLALDIGSNIAVAHNLRGAGDERVDHFTAEGDRVVRAGLILEWLGTVFAAADANGGVDAVVYERPFARGQHATRSLWGVAGLVEGLAGQHGWPCVDYAPTEIKKHATGNGKASKDDMILAASLTGYMGDNEHEADAWCCLRFAEDNLKPAKSAKSWKGKTK